METQAEMDKADATAAFCGRCKQAVFLGVTARLDEAAKKELAYLVVAGCDIKHLPVSEARKLNFGCEC